MPADSPTVEADLFEDFAEILRDELRTSGFTQGIDPDPHVVCRRFENYHRRRISTRQRDVCRTQPFHYPDESEIETDELVSRVDNIAEKAEAGENLNPFLSRRLKNLSYEDALLNDWGIHHFHLGKEVKPDGFMESTGSLLYARVTKDCIYMIGVFDHDSFSDGDLIEVEHENWRYVISKYKLPNDIDLLYDYKDDQIHELSKAGVQVPVKLDDGTVYMHPGGGYSSTGEGVGDVMVANGLQKIFRSLDKSLQEDAEDLIEFAENSGHDIDPPLNIRLGIDGTLALAVEEDTGETFRLIDMENYRPFTTFLQTRQAV